MKTTSLTGLALTLLMLLLVLIAAFVFLFQGRQQVIEQRDTLEDQTAVLQQDLAQTELDLAAVEATRAATADALATAESSAVLLDGELVRSQQEVDALTDQIDAISQTITALESEQEAVLSQPPEVAILSPANGRILSAGEPTNIVVVATHPNGVASVSLTINEEPVASYTPENETLFTAVSPWEPVQPNEYVIKLTAVNHEGISSQSATVTVTVALAGTASRSVGTADVIAFETIDGLVSGLRQLPSGAENVSQNLVAGTDLRQAQQEDALALAQSEPWLMADLVGLAFDFAPAGYGYEALLQAVHNASTPTLYRPLSDEMLLEEAGLQTAVAQLGYVRQLLYQIQDQNFGLDVLTTGDLTLDGSLALAALREGEATVVQENFLTARYLSLDTAVIPETWVLDTQALAEAPPAIANRLLFPYEYGDEFARFVYEIGNYPMLNEAWANPPQSTEQILHPEKFLAEEGPLLVTLPDLQTVLGDEWTLAAESVLGEFMLGQYLAQQLTETQVESAVSGWGGDRFAIYTNEADGSFLLALHTVWDTTSDSSEFVARYINYPQRLFGSASEVQPNGGECWPGEAELICLYQSEQETLIVRGPDEELVLNVVNAVFPVE